jgi:hypothetical protein
VAHQLQHAAEAERHAIGQDAHRLGAEHLGQVVKKELAKWPQIIKAANIRVD